MKLITHENLIHCGFELMSSYGVDNIISYYTSYKDLSIAIRHRPTYGGSIRHVAIVLFNNWDKKYEEKCEKLNISTILELKDAIKNMLLKHNINFEFEVPMSKW